MSAPGDKKPASFNEAVEWAKNNINKNREKNTWDAKFWYVIIGIIILIIIIGLIYIYYKRKANSTPINEYQGKVLESLNCATNQITPAMASPRNLGVPPPVNPINPPGISSPNGVFVPAVSSGVQQGWWYHPPNSPGF
jgi:hypothetical protein